MKITFNIDDSISQELVEAIAENHAILSTDGVKPNFSKQQWAKEYFRQQIKSELEMYRNSHRPPIVEILDNFIQ